MSEQRLYAMTKVAAGDYLLPSNDGRTIWRLRKYDDGPSSGITDWDHDKTFWGIWKWIGLWDYVDIEDWTRWEMIEGNLATRSEAISEVLRVG